MLPADLLLHQRTVVAPGSLLLPSALCQLDLQGSFVEWAYGVCAGWHAVCVYGPEEYPLPPRPEVLLLLLLPLQQCAAKAVGWLPRDAAAALAAALPHAQVQVALAAAQLGPDAGAMRRGCRGEGVVREGRRRLMGWR